LKCEFIIWELEEQVSYFNSCPILNFELGIKVEGWGVRANIKLLKYDAQKPILLLIIQQQLLILF
jgi:hypothetical protein